MRSARRWINRLLDAELPKVAQHQDPEHPGYRAEDERPVVEHFEVAAYDHGFVRPYTRRRFATLPEAEAYIAEQDAGRKVSPGGRVVEDVAWHIFDLHDAHAA